LRTSASSCVAQEIYLSDITDPSTSVNECSCCIVVDSGHSFTHVVPFIQGQIVRSGIVRIDVGGKALTNQLKEWVSFRHMNVLEETYMINQCKEDICFVTTDLQRDMKRCQSGYKFGADTIKRDYILPDFVDETRGVVQMPSSKTPEDRSKICLGVERFATPEILFHPSDVGLNQMGIVEAIHHLLKSMPEEVRFEMLKNIVLIGGNSLFEGYKERIELELRPLVDEVFEFKVNKPADPITHGWTCATKLVSNSAEANQGPNAFLSKFVTRAEFNEHGPNICQRRFKNFFDEENF